MKNIIRTFYTILSLIILVSCTKTQEIKIAIQDENNLLQNEECLIDSVIQRYDYKILIVKPDPHIDYKILVVKPDPNIDFKIIIIDPKNNKPVKMSKDVNKMLLETIENIKNKK